MEGARLLAVSAGMMIIGVAGTWGPPALAQLSSAGTGNCRMGLTVKTRDGKVGEVVKASGNSCWVQFADGTKDYFIQWMLTPVSGSGNRSSGANSSGAGSSGASSPSANKGGSAGSVRPGNYQCYGGAAGNMRVTLDGSGRWKEFYTRTLPNGKVGITGRPGAPAYMICERR